MTDTPRTKTISLMPLSRRQVSEMGGKEIIWVVEVDWFPLLNEEQHFANLAARLAMKPVPYPNPNIIEVTLPLEEDDNAEIL